MTDRTAEQQAADVKEQRLAAAQAAREKREFRREIIPGANSSDAEAMRARIARATRDRRKALGAEVGRVLQQARWVETQMGGSR